MRRLLPVLLLAVCLPAAASAQAQTPPPVNAKITLDLQKVGHVKRAVAFSGKAFRVRGQLAPFVAGQVVHVRVYRGAKMILAKTKPVVALGDGSVGGFVADFKTALRGRVHIRVSHFATTLQRHAYARTEPVEVIGSSAYPGQTGYTVGVMQRLLRDIGYVPGHKGTYDDRTARAVLTFRKMSGLARITTASRTVLRRLINGGGQFEVRYPRNGHHVEGDLTHQVLALINGNKVERLYTMSSGKPSTPTVLGHYSVYLKTPGTNSHGMVQSSFFIRGYAIHGYADVPTYPASHGCLRVPVPDALAIYDWVKFGDKVDVYYRSGHHKHPKPSPNAGP